MAADPLTKSTVDDLFDTNFSDFEDDPFADKPTARDARDDKAVLSPRAGIKRRLGDDDKENDGLGLDEEVKISKKRKPIAKLDEARLLSEPGIPKLRAVTRSNQLKKKLRLKGKGHEFSDAARLLNHFQLWLDNLYPRAKFADALQLVEKAGHTKRMHMIRSEWINEGKPGYRRTEDDLSNFPESIEPDLFGSGTTAVHDSSTNSAVSKTASGPTDPVFDDDLDDDALFIPDANRPSQVDRDDEPDEDELDALLAANNEIPKVNQPSRQSPREDESEGEDDLDALLADQQMRQSRPAEEFSKQLQIREHDDEEAEDEDDLDALLAEQQTRTTRPAPKSASPTQLPPVLSHQNASDDEDDDLEALMAMQRTVVKPKPSEAPSEAGLPTPQATSSPTRETSTPRAGAGDFSRDILPAGTMFSSSPVPNNPEDLDLDDLDALLASQEESTESRGQVDVIDIKPSTPKAKHVEEEEEDFFGSPVPNEESQ